MDVPKISSDDRNLQGTVEQIRDVLVLEMIEQLIKDKEALGAKVKQLTEELGSLDAKWTSKFKALRTQSAKDARKAKDTWAAQEKVRHSAGCYLDLREAASRQTSKPRAVLKRI